MSYITAGVEYGLHCLLYLIGPGGEAHSASARDLADFQGVPVEYLAKLFTKLQKAGLVIAAEGARGGFRLAREANQITVLDVVVAIDGEKSLFECKDIRERCAVFGDRPPAWATRGVCGIHAIMLEAEARMRQVLAASTLADIAASVAAKSPRSFNQEIVNWFASRSPGPRRTQNLDPED